MIRKVTPNVRKGNTLGQINQSVLEEEEHRGGALFQDKANGGHSDIEAICHEEVQYVRPWQKDKHGQEIGIVWQQASLHHIR